MLNLPAKIVVSEVGPRDGLQSLDKCIDTDTKIAMIDRLSRTRLPVIEVTGFARASVIPNLKDAEEVCARIQRRPGTVYRALVPNVRGTERALESRLDELLGLITVSETYLRKNQNMSPAEAEAEGIACFRKADAAGVGFVMAVGVALWCTYEGLIPGTRPSACSGVFATPASSASTSPAPPAWKTRCRWARSSAAWPRNCPTARSATTCTTCRVPAPPTCWRRWMPAPRSSKVRSAASAAASRCPPAWRRWATCRPKT
jgi:hypothetical protein